MYPALCGSHSVCHDMSPSAQRVSSGIKVKLSSQRDRLGIKIKPGASSWKIVSLKIEECQNLMLTPVSWLEIIPEGLAHPHTARLMFKILQNCTNCSSTRVNTRTHLYLVPSQPGVSDTSHKLERNILPIFPVFSPHSTLYSQSQLRQKHKTAS